MGVLVAGRLWAAVEGGCWQARDNSGSSALGFLLCGKRKKRREKCLKLSDYKQALGNMGFS